ncbi:hypothetical protein I317_04882 [Kwoniella heveanensis CBS 569]|nr:hypothetical protein I317_04882 [Kwoniella heveanensis CBS 569]
MDLALPSIASLLFVPSQPPQEHLLSMSKEVKTTRKTLPFTPTRLAPPPPLPLLADIPDTDNSPPRTSEQTQEDRHTVKGRLDHRPVTPLDFFGSSNPDTDKTTMTQDRRGLRVDPHASARVSVDLGRPAVDPSIKGIPQGWDDDPTIPLALQSRPTAPPSGNHQQTIPLPRSTGGLNQSTPLRMGPFRETRTKLSSFSGKMRDGLREKDKDKDLVKPGSTLKLHKGSVRLTQRSSSMNPGLITKRRPTSPSHGTHNPTHSVYSESSFNTHGTGNTSGSIPPVPPSAQTESTEASTDFSHLFTPSPTAAHEPDYPASIGSGRSVSSRDRVMGLKIDPTPVPPAGMKTFIKPNVADVLPFAAGHPFTAWSAPNADETALSTQVPGNQGNRARRGSIPMMDSMFMDGGKDQTTSPVSLDGWKEAPRSRAGLPGKKVWVDAKGEEIATAYRVGWEREVIDLEARLHETMYDIAGERHTFVEVSEPPQAVLDLGTGAGFWPVSMALQWPQSTFIGMDLVPCQVDLSLLASAERTARSTSDGQAKGLGVWESVEQRITWQRGNFLDELPFDTGVFDLVHLRFVNLGVPETKWFDLLEEATRVLKRGGKLEIVETSYRLPGTASVSLRNSFASMILADMVHSLPLLPLQFNLPSIDSLKGNSGRPTFERAFKGDPPGALHDAVTVWVKSALEYKGTSIVKNISGGKKGLQGIGERVKKELMWADKRKWAFDEQDESVKENTSSKRECKSAGDQGHKEDEVGVWVWVPTKK